MLRPTWVHLAGFAAALCPAVSGGQVLRVITDADAAAVAAAGGPTASFTVTPLYGGSDRSAFRLQTLHQSAAGSAAFRPFTLFDVPAPADLRTGDALVGRLDDASSGGWGTALHADLSVAGPDGRWSPAGHFDVPPPGPSDRRRADRIPRGWRRSGRYVPRAPT